jgi:hypothetical protein
VGDGEGEVSLFFLVVSFLVVVVSFLAASVDVFLVDDFLVVSFLVVVEAGAVVVVDSFLVVHEAMSPAANITVME